MVMSDRNTDDYKNGRRLRSDSPDSSDDSGSSEDSDRDHGMRVGRDFQAVVPEYKPDGKFDPKAEAMLVWAPSRELSGVKTDEYINFAKEKHGYNTEQALGMLFWHKHNVEKAIADLPNFTPFPDEWTVEDKVLFEQAFSFHGKSFHRIRQMLPDKSIASLVKYYYSWKKTRSRTSLMDRQARKLSQKDGDSDGRSEDGSSDSEETENKENGKEDKVSCSNCSVKSSQLNPTPKGSLCNTCYQYWRRTGIMRTVSKSSESRHEQRHSSVKHKRKPPRGMYLNQEDLMSLLTGPPGQPEALLKSLETELVGLKRQVQNNKQMISLQKHKTSSGIDHLRSNEAKERINNRWTNEELLLAVQGVRKYGKNFQAISEVIGNKSESHVRSFFINFRRRYNLDDLLAEYEAEHGCDGSRDEDEDIEDEKMEIDSTPENNPQMNSLESNGASAPPPLLKQPPGSPKSNMSTSRLLPTPKTGLQQPPPLIRPNGSPATVKTND